MKFNNVFEWMKNILFGVFRYIRELFMGRLIVTIDEIIAGRGLHSNKETTPPAIEVYCGQGLKYGDNDDLAIDNGPGIEFGLDGELQVSNTDIAGAGLVAGEGCQVNLDIAECKEKEFTFRVVTDAKFQMDGYHLVFCTTYTTFIVHKNWIGLVLCIEQGDSVTECQPLNINGYGGIDNAAPNVAKPGTSAKPSFYK
jgi:hypothetical protein